MGNPNQLSREYYPPATTGDVDQVTVDNERAEQKKKDEATKAALAQKAFQATLADSPLNRG